MKKILLALVAAVALSGLATTAQAYPYWGYGYYQPYGYRVPYRAYYRAPLYRQPWRAAYAYPYGSPAYPPYGVYYGGYTPYGAVVYGPRYGYRAWAW
ncbi:MAG TPA: lipoprotein [Pirellulales bacterium]|jgi:hypothetical protein|nr:lipoprotein [Pirellulales bacterium]